MYHIAFRMLAVLMTVRVLTLNIRETHRANSMPNKRNIAGVVLGIAITFLDPQLLISPGRFYFYSSALYSQSLNQWRVSTHHSYKIKATLRTIRTRKMKESRDKSYAIYGVLKRLDIEIEESNYAKLLDNIYRELFIKLISWKHGLNLLLDSGFLGTRMRRPGFLTGAIARTEVGWIHVTFTRGKAGRPPVGRKLLGRCCKTRRS